MVACKNFKLQNLDAPLVYFLLDGVSQPESWVVLSGVIVVVMANVVSTRFSCLFGHCKSSYLFVFNWSRDALCTARIEWMREKDFPVRRTGIGVPLWLLLVMDVFLICLKNRCCLESWACFVVCFGDQAGATLAWWSGTAERVRCRVCLGDPCDLRAQGRQGLRW